VHAEPAGFHGLNVHVPSGGTGAERPQHKIRLVSDGLRTCLRAADFRAAVTGSDHRPVTLTLDGGYWVPAAGPLPPARAQCYSPAHGAIG
jgi:hypothetical protein